MNGSKEVLQVTDLDQFVALLTTWHTDKCALVRHWLTVPAGSEFMIGEDKLVLTPENLAAFKFGIEMALMQLGTLPFVAEVEDQSEPIKQ